MFAIQIPTVLFLVYLVYWSPLKKFDPLKNKAVTMFRYLLNITIPKSNIVFCLFLQSWNILMFKLGVVRKRILERWTGVLPTCSLIRCSFPSRFFSFFTQKYCPKRQMYYIVRLLPRSVFPGYKTKQKKGVWSLGLSPTLTLSFLCTRGGGDEGGGGNVRGWWISLQS